MRTTLDIPDDLHQIASSVARHTRRSLGQVVAELMRRGLEAPAAQRLAEPGAVYCIDAETGLPVIAGATRPMTDDDVRALDDRP